MKQPVKHQVRNRPHVPAKLELAQILRKMPGADEYDAAQLRGDVAGQGKPSIAEGLATVADIGLSHKDIHEAREIRDAEET